MFADRFLPFILHSFTLHVLHFGDREGELDQLLRKLVGAVFVRAEGEIAFFAYAHIAISVLATQPVVVLDQFTRSRSPDLPVIGKRWASRLYLPPVT